MTTEDVPVVPVACSLTSRDAARQVVEWTDLQALSTATAALPNGATMRFPADLEPQVADLAHREATCCAFLSITTRVADDELLLEVTSDNPDAKPIISLLAGISMP